MGNVKNGSAKKSGTKNTGKWGILSDLGIILKQNFASGSHIAENRQLFVEARNRYIHILPQSKHKFKQSYQIQSSQNLCKTLFPSVITVAWIISTSNGKVERVHKFKCDSACLTILEYSTTFCVGVKTNLFWKKTISFVKHKKDSPSWGELILRIFYFRRMLNIMTISVKICVKQKYLSMR